MVGLPAGTYIAAVLVFIAVALGTVSLSVGWEWLRERRRRAGVSKQLEKLATEGMPGASGPALFRGEEGRGRLGRFTERLPHLHDINTLMEQAAISWSPQTFLLLSGGFAVALGVGVLIATRGWLLALIGAAVGAYLPRLYVGHRRTKRMHAFEEQLPEAVDLLGRAIRAGHPISAGFKMVSEEAPEPIASEFRRIFEEQRFGLSFDDSMLGMADRVPLIDVRIFATAVLIQREVGGNLAEILDKLSDVIRQRFSILRQLRVYTAQGRLSGYILAGLPVFLGLVLFMINRENMIAFVNAPLGKMLMTVAVVLQILGFLWMRKIIKIEV